MPIVFACQCGRQLRAKDGSIGRIFACPACGAKLEVPPPDAVDLGIDTGDDGVSPDQLPYFFRADPSAPTAVVPAILAPIPATPQVVPCEFEYKMVQLPPNTAIKEGVSHRRVAADFLEEVVNRYAASG